MLFMKESGPISVRVQPCSLPLVSSVWNAFGSCVEYLADPFVPYISMNHVLVCPGAIRLVSYWMLKGIPFSGSVDSVRIVALSQVSQGTRAPVAGWALCGNVLKAGVY